jgi:hypothetical protein
MWIYTHCTMALRNRYPEEISGENRAVLELAVAMQTELDIKDTDPSVLRERELKESIKHIRGGTISSAYLSHTLRSHSIRQSLMAWFRIEKWWFVAMFITSAFCATGWLFMLLWIWIWFLSIWFGQFWAFCVGTTVGSRLLIILFWSVVGLLVIAMSVGMIYGYS